MQGVDMFLGQEQMDGAFLCDGCKATRDQACEHCTNWAILQSSPVGPKLLEKVKQLAQYIEAKIQEREDQEKKATVVAVDELEPEPALQPSTLSLAPSAPKAAVLSSLLSNT